MTARDDAIAAVQLQCQTAVYPTLSDDEVDGLVDAAANYVVWGTATPYTVGQIVAPTVRNGHLYRCLVAGTSASTEPFWPLYSNPDDAIGVNRPYWTEWGFPWTDAMVGDGASLIWIEAGPDLGSQYDIRTAVYKGWLLKAAKASADYDGTVNLNALKRSQVYEHCIDMAQRLVPIQVF